MIFHPRHGQRVRLHYAKRSTAMMPHHGRTGVVRIVGAGPGPRNVGVAIDGGGLVVASRGNLVATDTPGNE
jgi:hypothetical protein